MSYKSNFESMRFLSDDPNYFEQGYELGKGVLKILHNVHNLVYAPLYIYSMDGGKDGDGKMEIYI